MLAFKALKSKFGRNSAQLFLGTMAVVPRKTSIKSLLEQRPLANNVEPTLLQHLQNTLQLPAAPSATEAGKNDVALDLFLTNYQRGEATELFAGEFFAPLTWRAKVSISARLYKIKNGRHLAKFEVSKALPWKEHLSAAFSGSNMIGWKAFTSDERLTRLLDEALYELLLEVKSKL